ncbi:MAG: hypothetical protein LBT66_05590 [Methanobrevibacter sp.]|nr:hypothetical protein [Candidatus Methanovirga meridionalis]
MKWKNQSYHEAQTPSIGTLKPFKEESKDWDTTKNLYTIDIKVLGYYYIINKMSIILIKNYLY